MDPLAARSGMAKVPEMAAFICQKSYASCQCFVSFLSVSRLSDVCGNALEMRHTSVDVRRNAFSVSDMSVIRQFCK